MSLKTPYFTGEFSTQKEDLTCLASKVLEEFEESEDVLKAARNTLKKIEFDGYPSVVKAFRIPSFPQNYIYGLWEKSKAEKSYRNANKLIELGFSTPKPLGFFEHREGWQLKESYYVCRFQGDAQTLLSLWNDEVAPDPELIDQFAAYCYRLHQNGILHRDFNPDNVLVSNDGGVKDFALVDINRITWSGPLSLDKAMESMARLPCSKESLPLLLEAYAEITGASLARCRSLLQSSRDKIHRNVRNKKLLRKVFPKK